MPSRLDPRRGVGDLSPAADEREWRLVVGERGHRLVPSGRSAGWDVAGCLDPHRAGRGGGGGGGGGGSCVVPLFFRVQFVNSAATVVQMRGDVRVYEY